MNTFRGFVVVLSLLSGATLWASAPAAVASGQSTCTDPVWVSSGPGGGRSGDGIYHPGDSPYINDNNMWNAAGYNMTETMSVCSHNSWYVDATVPEPTDTAVKAYPNVHVDYHNWVTGYEPPLSSYDKITSSYAGRGPGVGTYDVAYDMWLNGVGGGANEVMIWTENRGQRPAGSVRASNVTISGRSWDVWTTSSNRYVAFVPTNGQAYPSGTLELTAFFNYLIGQGRLPATSTLGQVDYGIEFVSTGGGPARFTCTDFSVSPPHRGVEG